MRKNSQNIPYSVSQNYLTSKKTIKRLIRIAKLDSSDTVLEIGAGKGHITRVLAETCRQVISYEVDPRLYVSLKRNNLENVTLIGGDFLQARLPSGPYRVFANIPFSRTTEIIKKLTCGDSLPKDCWLIVEKGAAKRFCGKPHESLQSLLIKPFFETEICYYFQREDFHPAPRVDVVMLHLSRKEKPDIALQQRKAYEFFLRSCLQHYFGSRRTLLSLRQANMALRNAGLPGIHGQSKTMLYVQWLCLFRWWTYGHGQ